MRLARTVPVAALCALAFAQPALGKRLPPPPPSRSLTCAAKASSNHEAATIEAQADGVHVRIAADSKLPAWWKLDHPNHKAHKALRTVVGGGALELVFPTTSCTMGADAGILRCGAGETPIKAILTGADKKGRRVRFELELAHAGLDTTRIDTTTVDGASTGYGVGLMWGADAQSTAAATYQFVAADACGVK